MPDLHQSHSIQQTEQCCFRRRFAFYERYEGVEEKKTFIWFKRGRESCTKDQSPVNSINYLFIFVLVCALSGANGGRESICV